MLEVYPIGRARYPDTFDAELVSGAIERIDALPDALRAALAGCRDVDAPVRDGIWSIRVLTQHVADAHMVAFVRTKLALTEEAPTVPSYDQVAWSKLGDAEQDVRFALDLVTALHARWVGMLRAVQPAEWERPWLVRASSDARPLWRLPLTYAWHGEHHTAQIRRAREHYDV